MKSSSYLKCCTQDIMSPEDQVCDKTMDDYFPDMPMDPDVKKQLNDVSTKYECEV